MASCRFAFDSLTNLLHEYEASVPLATAEPSSLLFDRPSEASQLGTIHACQPVSAACLTLVRCPQDSSPDRCVVFRLAISDESDTSTDICSLATLASVTRFIASIVDTRKHAVDADADTAASIDLAPYSIVISADCKGVDIRVPMPSDAPFGFSVAVYAVFVAGHSVRMSEVPFMSSVFPKVPPNTKLKFILTGDRSVGKTSLLRQIADNVFEEDDYRSTIGIDFRILRREVGGEIVKIILWDTPGYERFRSPFPSSNFRTSQGTIVVYDITSRESFDHVRQYCAEIRQLAAPGVPVLLLGNKCDRHGRVVSEAEGRALAAELQVPFFETSAKTAHNTEQAFRKIVEDVIVHRASARQLDRIAIERHSPLKSSTCSIC